MSSSSPKLHPKVREYPEPRMSATALAEYLILQADGQETILHNSRFSRPPIVTANAAALDGLRAYNCDPLRDKSALGVVKKELKEKILNPDTKPKAKDEARRCIEAVLWRKRPKTLLGPSPTPRDV